MGFPALPCTRQQAAWQRLRGIIRAARLTPTQRTGGKAVDEALAQGKGNAVQAHGRHPPLAQQPARVLKQRAPLVRRPARAGVADLLTAPAACSGPVAGARPSAFQGVV